MAEIRKFLDTTGLSLLWNKVEEELETKADATSVPTNVSELTNDAGYLTQETDPTVPAWAKTVNKPTYTAQEVGALPSNTFIPSKVSDLTDDSGHYTKPVTGIPAADLEETYLTQHQDISMKANSADLATVATSGSYNDLLNKPTIPTAVSQLTDDSGHYTKPANGIPASDLEETYLTSFTETDPTVPNWAKQAQKPSYTAQEVGALPADTVIPTVPTNVSAFTNDAGYITGYTETDPTVPAWAKAAQKPTYTAAEVGAPTVQEMNTAIGNAIGNINSFDITVVQELPTQDISTHTIYLVPKTGETNDVYDEYIYINNAWEMVGNTQIDLSNYVQKDQYASADVPGLIKTNPTYGLSVNNQTGLMSIIPAMPRDIRLGTAAFEPITVNYQHNATFYGLAKAAGDTTQSQSDNAVGTYTDTAKTAIRAMLGAAASTDIPNIPVQDVQIAETSILSNGIANIPYADSTNSGGIVRANNSFGIAYAGAGLLSIYCADATKIKTGTNAFFPIVPYFQHTAAFYGLAKAAGDTTQSQSDNAVGTYTDDAKTAIQSMLGVPSTSDLNVYATKTDTVLETSLSRGRKENSTVGVGSLAFGYNVEATGSYSAAFGTGSALAAYAYAEGHNTLATKPGSHAEGSSTQANGNMSHAEGTGTIACGTNSHAQGMYNIEDDYNNWWPEWTANTSYAIGDKVRITTVVDNETVVSGYICKTANTDSEFTANNWTKDTNKIFADIIGNGTNNSRSNAYALEWDGTAHYAGDIYVGCNSDSTGGTRLATVTELATKLDAAEAGLKVVRLI